MQHWRQLVSTGIVAAILSVPLFALAPCAPSADSMQCPPDCPMMAAMQTVAGGNNVSAAPQTSSCCEMSSGQSTPTSELQVPTTFFSTAAPVVQVTSMTEPVASGGAQDFSPPPLVFSSQAVLCTFLI